MSMPMKKQNHRGQHLAALVSLLVQIRTILLRSRVTSYIWTAPRASYDEKKKRTLRSFHSAICSKGEPPAPQPPPPPLDSSRPRSAAFNPPATMKVLVFSIFSLSAALPASAGTPKYDEDLGCWPVSVEHDATYCIDGPVCSGEGSSPTGSLCPVKGDVAIADCDSNVTRDSVGDYCELSVDTVCEVIHTGAWGCVIPTNDHADSYEHNHPHHRNSHHRNSHHRNSHHRKSHRGAHHHGGQSQGSSYYNSDSDSYNSGSYGDDNNSGDNHSSDHHKSGNNHNHGHHGHHKSGNNHNHGHHNSGSYEKC
uniref:Uncharacterized protein n=1 Tax=Hyaloperonospora arabidopsidis (strain Emoy2) TaxID=559515 RepID=M4C5K0_HYAAE